MVVSSRPELLRTAATWISRLDKIDTASSGVKVYRVKYGDAKQLAGLLNDIFIGRSTVDLILPSIRSHPAGAWRRPQFDPKWRHYSAEWPPRPTGCGPSGYPRGRPGLTSAPSTGRRTGSSIYAAGIGTTSSAGNGDAILPGVRITPDVANNSLLVYANKENYRIIEQTLYQLDRPQLQVSIDATIAEITLNNSLKYGVQYFLQSKDVGLKPDTGSVDLVNAATSAVLSRALPGFNFLLGSEANPRIILDALRGVSDVKVLSAPSVVVLDNQVATLQVGDADSVTTNRQPR